jgi:hypothetical protein
MQESATRTILSVSGESVKIQDVSKTARKTAKRQSVQMGKTAFCFSVWLFFL